MNDVTIRAIAEGLRKFQPSISFATHNNPVDEVFKAIHLSPRIAYYIHGCSIAGAMGNYVAKPQYIHKDTQPDDVFVADSKEDCLRYMDRFAGDYKKKLTMVVRSDIDVSNAVDEFNNMRAPFYPNLVSISAKGYHAYGGYDVYEVGFDYRIGQVKLKMMEREVDEAVEGIAKLLFTSRMPKEAKVYLAHNYLALNVKYKKKEDNPLSESYAQSAYGALIERECVCQGYAEAFKRIMDYAGIECDVICGEILGSTEHHAWNIVSLSKWKGAFHVDVTWDANSRRPDYRYFAKDDGFFDGKRVWNKKLYRPCFGGLAVADIARNYIKQNKAELLLRGIDKKVLDC